MIEVHIDTTKLWAMHLLAGQHNVRAYLNGVRIEANDGETRMQATDGIKAAWLRGAGVADIANECDGRVEFTIPNDIIEAYCKLRKGTVNAATVLIQVVKSDEDPTKVYHSYTLRMWDGTRIPFEPPPGVYPAMTRIRPTDEASGEGANLDGEHMNIFAKVHKLLTGARFPHSMATTFDGAKPIRVQFPDYSNFLGILMPMKPVTAPVDPGWDWPATGDRDE